MCSASSTLQVAASEVLVNALEWVHGFVARRQHFSSAFIPLKDTCVIAPVG